MYDVTSGGWAVDWSRPTSAVYGTLDRKSGDGSRDSGEEQEEALIIGDKSGSDCTRPTHVNQSIKDICTAPPILH